MHARLVVGTLTCAALVAAAGVTSAQDTPQSPELVVQTGHQEQISSVAFSADSRLIATGDDRGSTRIWETSTGKQLRALGGDFGDHVGFSRDGRRLAASRYGFSSGPNAEIPVKVWDVATGQDVRSLSFPGEALKALALSADGAVLAAAGDGGVRVWNVETGEQVAHISTDSESVTLAFDPRSPLLAIREPARLRFWTPSASQISSLELSNFSGDGGMVFLADGHWLAVPDRGRVLIVDVAKHAVAGRFAPNGDWRLRALPDSSTELVVATGNRYEVWDVVKLKKVRDLARKFGKGDEVPSPSWGWMATPNEPNVGALRLEDLAGAREPLVLGGHVSAAGAVAFSPDGSQLATKTGRRFWVWDLASGEPRLFDGHKELPGTLEIDALAFGGDGRHLISADQGSAILEWDVASGKVVNSVGLTIEDSTFSHACSTDGRWCVTGDSKRIDVRDTETWRVYRTLEGFAMGRAGVEISADGGWIATSSDKTVILWNRANGSRRELEGQPDDVSRIAFAPSNRRLAVADWSGNVKVWDIDSGREALGFQSEQPGVTAIAFSPDGRALVTAGLDDTLRVWSPDSGALRHVLRGHADWIAKVAFSPNGRLLASGSHDGTVRLWDVDSGTAAALLVAAKDSEDWLVVTPDGRFDGSAGADALVAWRIGMSAYAPDRYFNRLFTPGLLASISSGKAPVVGEGASLAVPPSIRILEDSGKVVQDPKQSLRVRVDGPAAEVRLYHNGVRVASRPGSGAASADYTFDLDLIAGVNELRGIAVSPSGDESNPDSIRLTYDAPPTKPALYVLTIGVSKYQGANWNLGYARADAEAIAGFFKDHSAKLFATVSATVLPDDQATRANIQGTLASIAERARPEDVVLLYFAGHGVALDQTYYMLPYEMHDEAALAADVMKFGFSDRALLDAFRKIKALKKVVILDSCQSEGALDVLGRSPAAERAALETLVHAEGLFVIAASTRQEQAIEVPELGHGIFTYALLSGLGATGDPSVPPVVTMHELLTYVSQKVPELAARYTRQTRQVPVSFSRGMDFPLVVR
jgi:WD40 repeat protein